ncbi:uncharacterized protein LOC113468224 [Diaphorina citri]|uniref:Uncharacterized protein LOC113468224 n=1 Tax=Diaphorina citri TaxID=121845 RepID=A0A3Q0J1G7_DIACI|nr:uncharacterized protein LOC113468224 [Diaphorina citri]
MIVEHFKTLDNVVKVTFFKDHFGHDIELEHLPLSKLDRDLIAGKLLQGVPADTVLDQVRDSIKGTCERIHLISKRQIQRIEQCIGLTSSVQRDENDLTSVAMFVEESKDSTENVVILYKNQGEVHPVLDKQDFVLGIMSKAQEAMLKKFGTNGIICMDSTHGTNPYDFNLITVLTVDDFGEGFPVAFLYANKEDETTLSLFLNSIKEKIGTINASTFMSDDAPQYYNSWKNVMGSTAKKLLCTWHVDRAWQGKINLIAKDKKIVVYRMLKKLQTETCKEKFVVLLQEFLQMLGQDKDLSNFREYFETYYLNRVENWAYCHRLFSNINTNMYLEAMHRVIKHVYMKGNKLRRLDKSLDLLLKFLRDKQVNRLIKIYTGKNSCKINIIKKKHAMSESMSLKTVVTGNGFWVVDSETVSDLKHTVCLNEFKPCNIDVCPLFCKECLACIHKYTCTCTDYLIKGNMCKHIHLVCRLMQTDVEEVSLPSEETLQASRDKEEEIQIHVSSLSNRSDMNPLEILKTKLKDELTAFLPQIDKIDNINHMKLIITRVKQLKTLIKSDLTPKGNPVARRKKKLSSGKLVCQQRFFSTKKKRVQQKKKF